MLGALLQGTPGHGGRVYSSSWIRRSARPCCCSFLRRPAFLVCASREDKLQQSGNEGLGQGAFFAWNTNRFFGKEVELWNSEVHLTPEGI